MSNELLSSFKNNLSNLYTKDEVENIVLELTDLFNGTQNTIEKASQLSDSSKILRVYPSKYNDGNNNGLYSLLNLLKTKDLSNFDYINIPQAHPSSTDDMDAPIDFNDIDPFSGDWEDLKALSMHLPIMVDSEFHHTSCESKWFKKYRAGVDEYNNYFIKVDADKVANNSELKLSEFETMKDNIMVLTSFGLEKPDLNYANPAVFVSICKLIKKYAEHNIKAINIKNYDILWFDADKLQHDKNKSLQLINALKDFNQLSGSCLNINLDLAPEFNQANDIDKAIDSSKDSNFIEIPK